MGDLAIRVENLSKQYRIGKAKLRHDTLRDQLTYGVKSLFSRNGRHRPAENSIWALKDVSFEIKTGEVVGIIGRNGAGKSTLLKILSRITVPTEGRAKIYGRVGSLLEVGTGFHAELSGRENIYLNGAILGMTKREIDRKFDEIVTFAEVEKFIDTPVKRYSSGMYVRLAFAVAAHLEPQILIVDEVLAVGDAAFQKKCLGKMGDVAKEGRTVFFVSHNLAAIQSLCTKAVLLDAGKLTGHASPQKIVQKYLQSTISMEAVSLEQRNDRSGDGTVQLLSLEITSADSDRVIRSSSRLKITITYRSERPVLHPQFLLTVYDYSNAGIFLLNSDAVGDIPQCIPAEGSITCLTHPINLTAGRCYVNIAVFRAGVMADYLQYAGYFDVEADDLYGSGKLPPRDWVLCLLQHKWFLGESGGSYEDVVR